MNNTIAKITEELGTSNVKDISFDEVSKQWVIDYNTDLPSDKFDNFSEVMEFLETEGNDE